MSAESKPQGTMGHVKGMAAGTYLYESERGNSYPRLHLTVDYRSPKNLRIRSYDENGHVVDTIGANDLAELCLLAGMTVRYAETMHARKLRGDGRATSKRRPPVALRFLDALTLQLRRQKAAGAAEVVKNAAGLQFHPTNWSEETERRRVLALAEHALRAWAIRGLKLRGGDYELDMANQLGNYLADQPPFSAEDAANVAPLLREVGEALRDPEEVSGPNPVTSNGVAAVLHEVTLALRHVGETRAASPAEAVGLPGDPLARSVEHAALALAAAFKAGVITELPTASAAAFAWLDRIG